MDHGGYLFYKSTKNSIFTLYNWLAPRKDSGVKPSSTITLAPASSTCMPTKMPKMWNDGRNPF